MSRIEKIFERKREILGIPSGFVDLDRLTSGWQNGDLIILAARPSHGKTALSLNMAYDAARHSQVPTVFFSMEQPKEQLVQRLLASVGQINASRLRAARMESQEWERFYQVDDKLRDVSSRSLKACPDLLGNTLSGQTSASLNRVSGWWWWITCNRPGTLRPKSREQEVGGISRSLKALAKELNLPVMALCQLNREVEKRPNRRPVLSDLRESGSIELDADLVLFIYRDELYREDSKDKGIAEVRLAKHRNGPTGLVNLAYRKEFMLFQNYVQKDERGRCDSDPIHYHLGAPVSEAGALPGFHHQRWGQAWPGHRQSSDLYPRGPADRAEQAHGPDV